MGSKPGLGPGLKRLGLVRNESPALGGGSGRARAGLRLSPGLLARIPSDNCGSGQVRWINLKPILLASLNALLAGTVGLEAGEWVV